MAGVVPSPGTPTGGSFGSITVGRNRYGTYWRNRTVPVQPNSPFQQLQKQLMSAARQAWIALPEINKVNWENWAAATPWPLANGETGHLTGQAAYIRSWISITQGTAGFVAPAQVANPPGLNSVMPLVASSFTADYTAGTGALIVTVTVAAAPTNPWNVAGGKLLCSVGIGMNASRRFFKGPFQYIREVASGEVSPPTAPPPLTAIEFNSFVMGGTSPYGRTWGYTVGQYMWIRLRAIGPLATDPRVSTDVILGPTILVAN